MDLAAQKIARFVVEQLSAKGRLGEREYYAHAFAVWLFAQLGAEFDAPRRAALDLIHANGARVDPRHPTKFHWEFVRFALQQAAALGGLEPYGSVRAVLGGEGFAYTRVANWTMLRTAVRLGSANPAQWALAHAERDAALRWFQLPGGFIEDQRGAPTAQYHAFSTAMLGVQLLRSPVARRLHGHRFAAAIAALERITFASGEMNVLGRGQAQSFGYAAAVLAYAIAARLFGEARYSALAERVFSRIARAQRADGSLPLVIGGAEDCRGEMVDLTDPRFLGWFSYNNYFDYLCFTGALLAFAARLPGSDVLRLAAPSPPVAGDEIADNIRMVRGPGYQALTAPPGRVLCDGMAIPFVETAAGAQPLPCYGGEMSYGALYKPEGLPLPVLVAPDRVTRVLLEPGAYRWTAPDEFTGAGPGWRLRRRIRFSAEGFRVEDNADIGPKYAGHVLRLPRILLLAATARLTDPLNLVAPGIAVQADAPLTAEETPQYCAHGKLAAFSADQTVPEGGLHCRSDLEFRLTP